MQSSSVSVQNLKIAYGTQTVLDGLSLDIRQGEFLVMLGSSGCGKSTLLNAIAGLQEVQGGSIAISGQDVTHADPKDRGIGMVFQSYALYPRMSVRQNMSFGLKIRKVPKAEIAARVERVAALLKIDHLLERRPADLSGGQRQRVAIGRALVRDVDVFLFDEPLSNLDAQLRTELRVELKKLHQSLGNTMIYVTHDQVEAMTLADRIAVMRNGKIQQLAPPAEIYGAPANLFVAGFLGSPRMNFLAATLTAPGRLSLSGVALEAPLQAAAGAVTLGIRPEDVGLAAPGTPATLPAVIEIGEDLGPETILWARLPDGASVALRQGPGVSLRPGQEVALALDLTRASFFDPQSETRLALA